MSSANQARSPSQVARALAFIATALLTFAGPGESSAIAADRQNESATEVGWQDEAALLLYEDRARAAGALGFYREAKTDSLVVVLPASRMTGFASNGPTAPGTVIILTTSFDGSDLEAARDRLIDLMTDHPRDSMAFGFDPRSQRLSVTTTIEPLVVSAALGRYADLIAYHQGTIELLSTRQADNSPFHGGAALAISQSDLRLQCTSAMKVLRNGGAGPAALLTAGHCYGNSAQIYSRSGARVGQINQRSCGGSTGNDMELIGEESYAARIYTGGINSAVLGGVIEAGNPAEGTYQYHYSGAASGEPVPAFEVTNSDFRLYVAESICGVHWVTHISAFRRLKNGTSFCDALPGDSGSPFFYKDASNNIRIRGMVFARHGNSGYCYSENWSRIQNQLNVTIATT
jgi:V8-like Glu-specific endopeptidase